MSRLPPELEIQIFESVARDSPYDAAQRLRLMLVARRVKIWVEPFVYPCLAFSRVNNWDRLKHIVATKPRDFLARHVKSICMPLHTVTMQEASEILSACTGVERLACWINHMAGEALAIPQSIPIQGLALSRLSIELSHFLCLPADLPHTHASLTHLELVYWEEHAEHYPATLDLARFPYLTHLALRNEALRFQWPLQLARSMKDSCGRLKVMVLVDFEVGSAEMVRRALSDVRAVVVLSQVVLHDWEPMAKTFPEWSLRLGKGDMWARGEDIIRRNMPR
ncbi:hypothetical protein B0H14DRAFT_3511012 [Mycena olivaceomarginata]|nr:hypothetical protein B0H14DRAFT_3511012 [Mycena olivaceomarginata]